MRTRKWIFNLICGLLLLVAQSAAQSFNYVSIDVPCNAFPSSAACPASGQAAVTVANGINAAGDIVGNYTDGNNLSHGFLLRDGQFSTIDVDFPWAAFTLGAYGISSGGDIVGRYRAKPNTAANPDSPQYCDGTPACIKGFLYHPQKKKFVTVLHPGHPGAFAQRITPDGDIYGCLHNHDLGNSMYSAIWLRSGENLSMIPGEGELTDPTLGLSMSMNNGATPDGKIIVGHYTDMTNHTHGFVVQNGAFQPAPRATCYDMSGMPCYDVSLSILTQIWDISPGRNFVGTYKDSSGHQHGFLQRSDGSAPIQLDYPGASATIAFGINPDSVIVGQYSTSGHVHGFAAVPASE
jgi:uncharacterized membrane protein